MADSPTSVSIRTYQVGFGDCFLLSFQYAGAERHVLIDFGSTGFPKGVPKTRMMDIATDIKQRTGGKLTAVVATHRHKDHISGFAPSKGKGTGDIIRSLKPDLVVQPWTEDLSLATNATGPALKKLGENAPKHISALTSMHAVAKAALSEAKRSQYFERATRQQLGFLGENNLANAGAVKNLSSMGKKNAYVHCGAPSGLEGLLPGVKVHVLGPPTLKQANTIRRQRSNDPDQFWQLSARAMNQAGTGSDARGPLFPKHVRSHGRNFPVDARWLIYHVRSTHAAQLLQLVRILDQAMNNTSVILLFQVGKHCLLFPGDAQIENWEFALGQKEYTELLAGVELYKIGHHGSRNATPKDLWKLFKNRAKRKKDPKRLVSLMSTMEGMHGHEKSQTEVPRQTLVNALDSHTNLFSTQQLEKAQLCHNTTLSFAPPSLSSSPGRKTPRRARSTKKR